MQARGDQQGSCPAQDVEGPRLPEVRREKEGEFRPLIVPDAVIVAGEDMKSVMAGPEIRIDSLTVEGFAFAPIRVVAIQAILESHPRWIHQAVCGVADGKHASAAGRDRDCRF